MLNNILRMIRNASTDIVPNKLDYQTNKRLKAINHTRMMDIYKSKARGK